MTRKSPSVLKAGTGPAIVCLHSSTSSSRQWKKFVEHLSHEYQVIAPDLYGYGDSPHWSVEQTLSLHDELELLQPVFDGIGGPFHLIGHSYGAAVAMTAAVAYPSRVRSLVLYEPVLFNLLLESDTESQPAREIRAVREDVADLVGRDQLLDAGRRFVNYWSGGNAWDKMEEWQRDAVAKRMPKVVADFDAVMGHSVGIATYRALDIPTLLLYGVRSPASTRAIAQCLWEALPKIEVRGLLGAGHMGPVTHAEQIYRVITKFIQLQPKGILVHQLKRAKPATTA